MAFKRNLGLGTRGKDPTTCKVHKKVLKMFYSKQPTQSRELRGSVINGNYHQRTLAGSIINNQKVMNYKTRQKSICRQFMIKLSVDQNLVVILQADSFQQFRRPNPQDLMIMTIDTNIKRKMSILVLLQRTNTLTFCIQGETQQLQKRSMSWHLYKIHCKGLIILDFSV